MAKKQTKKLTGLSKVFQTMEDIIASSVSGINPSKKKVKKKVIKGVKKKAKKK